MARHPTGPRDGGVADGTTPGLVPTWIRPVEGGTRLSLRVQPGARRTGFAGAAGDRLRMQVHAPAVDGAANDALLRYLAREVLGIAAGRVRILAGSTRREKEVEVAGVPVHAVLDAILSFIAPA